MGGSKGVEELALRTHLTNNGNAVLFVADHMFDKIRLYSKYIKQNKLVIMTANDPYALFDVTHALDKNLYICGMVFAQIVTGTLIGHETVIKKDDPSIDQMTIFEFIEDKHE